MISVMNVPLLLEMFSDTREKKLLESESSLYAKYVDTQKATGVFRHGVAVVVTVTS